MNPIRYLSLAVVLVLGCQGMPTVTRTGDVKDVIIGDNLASGEITVNPGDEVRWVNKRSAPVRVILIDPVSNKQVSCKSNFGGWMTSGDTAQLTTNETASICFRDAGTFRYTVRMESSRTAGELNVSGVIKVGGQGGGQAVGQTNDQNRGQSSGQTSARASEAIDDKPSDPVIQQAQGRPLPRLRRQRCLQLSECDIEKLLRKAARKVTEGRSASILLSEGVSPVYVQEQLGHATIELTVSTYGRWLKKKAPGALDRLDFVSEVASGSKTGFWSPTGNSGRTTGGQHWWPIHKKS